MFGNLKNFLQGKLEAVTLGIISLFLFWKSRPLSHLPLNSLDFSSHVFKIWYIVKHGITQWNPFWYGGFPFLNLHGPFSYIVASTIGELTSPVIAYNFIFNLSWILLPFAFYLFLKEYDLNKVQTSLALVIFSFFPVTLHYFRVGNLPLLFAFLLSILFWRSFKRFIEDKEGPTLSIVFFTLTLLSHPRLWFFLSTTILIWLFSKYLSKESIKKFTIVSSVTLLLSSFWLIPFIDSIYLGSEGSISVGNGAISNTSQTFLTYLNEMGIPPGIFILVVIILFSGFLYSLGSERKILKEFLPLIILEGISLFLLNYKRFSLFLLIPISILIAYRQRKLGKYFLLTSLVLTISFSFFSVPSMGKTPPIPKTGNRTIMYPPTSSVCQNCESYPVFLLPFKGVETINGWFVQVTKTKSLAGRKDVYLHKINQPLNLKYKEFNKIAKQGMVNYIIINSHSARYVEYFQNNSRFHESRETSKFTVFKAKPRFSYIQIDGKDVKTKAIKKGDKITANFTCIPGNLTIKETYDPDWKIQINGQTKEFTPTKYGFIETEINQDGSCNLQMSYQRIPSYSFVFTFIGIVILLGLAAPKILNYQEI